MRTNIDTLISALHILANDIQSEDGVANAAIREAAVRLHEERALADRLAKDLNDLWYHRSLTGAAYEVIESAITAWEEARK